MIVFDSPDRFPVASLQWCGEAAGPVSIRRLAVRSTAEWAIPTSVGVYTLKWCGSEKAGRLQVHFESSLPASPPLGQLPLLRVLPAEGFAGSFSHVFANSFGPAGAIGNYPRNSSMQELRTVSPTAAHVTIPHAAYRPDRLQRGEFVGFDAVALHHGTKGKALVVGGLDGGEGISMFSVRPSGEIVVTVVLGDWEPPQGTKHLLAEWVFLEAGSLWDGLRRYASLAMEGRALSAERVVRKPVGWCSWCTSWEHPTPSTVEPALDSLAKTRDRFGWRIAQLDDGYAAFQGDWLDPAPYYPDAVRSFSNAAARRGLIPGIWTSPLQVHPSSRFVREHPEWILRDSRGEAVASFPSNGELFQWEAPPRNGLLAVDVSAPGLLEHLEGIYAELRKRGYRYFKVDFLHAAFLNGKRHDPSTTTLGWFRRLLRRIRSAIGEDSFFLISSPSLHGMGWFDALRTGGDFSTSWYRTDMPCIGMPGILNSTYGPLWRRPFADICWVNDPDLYVLSPTRDDLPSEDECVFALVKVALADGSYMTSDNLSRLSPRQLALIEKLKPDAFRGAQPLDFGDHVLPLEWRLRDGRTIALDLDAHRVLGL